MVVTHLEKKIKLEAKNTGSTLKVMGPVLKFKAMDADNKEHEYQAS